MLRSLAVRLSSSGSCEGPGVTTLTDALTPPVLPGERPLVPTESAPSPEVGRAVSSDLLHEVISLSPGVQGDHPHPTAGAVAAGGAPGEGVASLPPGEEIVPALPDVVTTGPSSTAGLRRLGQGRGRDLHDASTAPPAGRRGGRGEGGERSVRSGGGGVE